MTATRRTVVLAAAAVIVAPALLTDPHRVAARPAQAAAPQRIDVPASSPALDVPERDAVAVRIFAWPVERDTPIIDGFGARIAPTSGASTFHEGLDLSKGVYGQPILAAAPGVVVDSGDLGSAGYGYFLTIAHNVVGEVFETKSGHMLRGSKTVNVGDRVSVGQVIGLMGSTGVSTGPHLHFEVHVNGQPIDPLPWLTTHVP